MIRPSMQQAMGAKQQPDPRGVNERALGEVKHDRAPAPLDCGDDRLLETGDGRDVDVATHLDHVGRLGSRYAGNSNFHEMCLPQETDLVSPRKPGPAPV